MSALEALRTIGSSLVRRIHESIRAYDPAVPRGRDNLRRSGQWDRRLGSYAGRTAILCAAIAAAIAVSVGHVDAAGRTVRVGVYQNEPKIFMDSAGQASGIYIDLLNKISADEGWTLVHVPCQWADCLSALGSGQIDLMPDMAYSTDRAQIYDFNSTPVLTSWSQVYANPRVTINGYGDLAGKRVAVLDGSIQQTVFGQYMSGFGLKVTIVPTASLEDAFKLTANGSVDAAIANNFFGDFFYKQYGLTKSSIVFLPSTLFFATAKGQNGDLLEAIDQHLNAWLQEPNSTYYTTLNHWTVEVPAPVFRIPQYIYWVISIIGGLLVLALAIVLLLRRQVRARTRYLEQANQALRESETRYQLISTAASDYMFSSRLDADGRFSFTWVAGAFETITGYTLEEYDAHGGWRAAVHPDDLVIYDDDIKKLRANQLVVSEIRTLTKSGLTVWVRVYARPVLDPAHKELTSIYGAVQDISDRKQSEERLAESEREYRDLVEKANSIILRWSHDGRITFLNEFGLRFFGYAAEEIIGKHVIGTIVPSRESDGRDLGRLMDQILADPVAFEQNVNENMRRTGERVWISWTNRIVKDASGRATEILSIGTDITERIRAQETLKASENQLSLILSNVSDVVFAVAVEPDGAYRFTSVNRRFLEVTGLSENYIVGRLARDVIPEPAQALVFGKYREAIQSGQPAHWEEVSDYPSGRRVGSVTVVPVINSSGICTQLVGMVHDITERKQAEDAIYELNASLEERVAQRTAELAVAKDRAEAADRLKSAFLANMSHELRTPLNSIIGFTGIILQELAGPLTEEQRKQLEMVRDSARHLLALINDVLDISKIEAGQMEVYREPFDLRALVGKISGVFQPLADKKGLELRVNLAPEIGTIVSDPRRVEQILLNLLNNAFKFTEQGGVTLTGEVEAGTLRISVADTGIGIRPEDLSMLFQPFRQIDSGLTRQHEGTGLGLSICRRLADLLGGEIRAASEKGKGSVFTLILPLKSGVKE